MYVDRGGGAESLTLSAYYSTPYGRNGTTPFGDLLTGDTHVVGKFVNFLPI